MYKRQPATGDEPSAGETVEVSEKLSEAAPGEVEEPAELKRYKVVGDFSTPVKRSEGVYEAANGDEAKKKFFSEAGIISTTRPVEVTETDEELNNDETAEDMSELFDI